MAFRVGQKVVYVGPDGSVPMDNQDGAPDPTVTVGNIYTVSNYYLSWDGQGMVELFETYAPGNDDWLPGYYACVFRPIVEQSTKTDISIFRKMLVPNSKSLETA